MPSLYFLGVTASEITQNYSAGFRSRENRNILLDQQRNKFDMTFTIGITWVTLLSCLLLSGVWCTFGTIRGTIHDATGRDWAKKYDKGGDSKLYTWPVVLRYQRRNLQLSTWPWPTKHNSHPKVRARDWIRTWSPAWGNGPSLWRGSRAGLHPCQCHHPAPRQPPGLYLASQLSWGAVHHQNFWATRILGGQAAP